MEPIIITVTEPGLTPTNIHASPGTLVFIGLSGKHYHNAVPLRNGQFVWEHMDARDRVYLRMMLEEMLKGEAASA